MGDKILVIHDDIVETYPGKTGVYAIFKLGDGTADDIPQTVVNGLTELGWLESKLPEVPIEITKNVETAVSYANWTDDPIISTDALNADKMNISGENGKKLTKELQLPVWTAGSITDELRKRIRDNGA